MGRDGKDEWLNEGGDMIFLSARGPLTSRRRRWCSLVQLIEVSF